MIEKATAKAAGELKAAAKPKEKAAANSAKPATKSRATDGDKAPVLLSGGNPQIAKGYGNEPVQAYIAAMPGWKHDIGKRLDAIIVSTLPNVQKAVKWNTAFYGLDGATWFLGFHCLTKYVKVAFMRGASLDPMPPGTSKQKDVRYLDIYENDGIDETQFADWVWQASRLPGEKL